MSSFGLNNEGELIFEYNVETNDTIGTQNVYNGKNSLLWQNFENAFSEEIKETYNSLRDSDKLTYESVLKILEGEQIAILSEAQYNEDAKYKYLDPLINENISTYLYIAQGSRINHLKYWLFNRFNYMDSKYIASDYKDNYATMRLYTPEEWSGVQPNSNFTITPFANQYSTVKFGSYVISVRGEADTPVEVVAPDIKFNDTETIIYGASRIASLGDLSDKYAGTVDMSKATQLTELIIGSSVEGYSNTNLKTVSVGNNKLLRKIDVRNCPNLTAPLDLSQCDNMQEVYATGTSVTSIKFSNGSELRTLTLPNTITSLTLINKLNLTSITSEGYDNLNTLRIENSAINPFTIINNCTALESVRLINIDCQTNVLSLQYLKTLKGMNESGVEIPLAQAVSGTITIMECSEELLEEFESAFPNVIFSVISFSQSWTVTFKDGDGNVVYTTKVLNNGEAVYLGNTPTKTSTAQYDYSWNGWDRQLKPITSNVTIIATFNNVLRYYTIRFISAITLEVVNSQYLAYGSTPTRPEITDGNNAWKPSMIEPVTGDFDYYTQYIPYPEDLSIFTFESITIDGINGYACSLVCDNQSVEDLVQVIIPFEYNGLPVIMYSHSTAMYVPSKIEDMYIPDSLLALGNHAFAWMSSFKPNELVFPNVKYFSSDRTSLDNKTAGQFSGTYAKRISFPKVQNLYTNDQYNPFFRQARCEICIFGSKEYPFISWHENYSSSSAQSFYDAETKAIFLVTENGLSTDVTFTGYDFMQESLIQYVKVAPIFINDGLFEYIVSNDEATITTYLGSETDINVPPTIEGYPVTKIETSCFENNTTITKVIAPDILTVGSSCFRGCSALTSIELPNATSLNERCFQECIALTSIDLPNVTSLGSQCFYTCEKLTSIDLPNVTSLGSQCFRYCSKLVSVNIPNATSLGMQCFQYCETLSEIKLPKLVALGQFCFYYCEKLTKVTLGDIDSPITNTDNFSTLVFYTKVTSLIIYVTDPSNPPTLTGSPWSATNATITYEQA